MQVSIKGNKDGYIITVHNKKDKFIWDVALLQIEILELQKALNKKFK